MTNGHVKKTKEFFNVNKIAEENSGNSKYLQYNEMRITGGVKLNK